MKKITDDIFYIGVNDHTIDLFEGQYKVPHGIAYNSYIIMDDKIAVVDTVDKNFTHEWLDKITKVLGNKVPDYLIVQHMEPDHSANIMNFLKVYPDTILVGNSKTFMMIEQFFHERIDKKICVNNMEELNLGKHKLTFVFAPMVHWPEVMVTYDSFDKVLFSADGFGKFGALDFEENWEDEARRYYIGIVGKYGSQVQLLLKKAKELDIKIICPLHGPVLDNNLSYYLNLYDIWSRYDIEEEGIVIAYTSIYGNTKNAVYELKEKLNSYGCPKIIMHDLARCDISLAVSDAFKYGKLILATTTYNADIFPFMKDYINHLVERNYSNRIVGFIENGSWAPVATKIMKQMLEKSKNIKYLNTSVSILSSLNDVSRKQIDEMSKELCHDYIQNKNVENKNDLSALNNIGYGMYVVTCNDGNKDNGLIVNTVTQVTNTPNRIAVTINKENYSHHIIKQTNKLNINCLTTNAPFSIFERFGFQSGRNTNKFENCDIKRSTNGLIYLTKYVNSMISLKVEQYVDLDTHGMFICSITEAHVYSNQESMSYTYYYNNVKPKPQTGVKGYVCKVCGFVYEGENLPEDYICPLCKHGVSDFEQII